MRGMRETNPGFKKTRVWCATSDPPHLSNLLHTKEESGKMTFKEAAIRIP
jgi:hypothetical protein